jgi:hypothetical protein
MKPAQGDLIAKVVKLGAMIRLYRSKGKLQSVAPPTIFGYRAFLRLAKTLPKLTLRQVALATMLGNAHTEDRKLIRTILEEALDSEDPDPPSEKQNVRGHSRKCRPTTRVDRVSPQFSTLSATWCKLYQSGLVQPALYDSHCCKLRHGDVESQCEIYEKTADPWEDTDLTLGLQQAARPIIERLNWSLSKTRHTLAQTRHRTITGSLDPVRLALASFEATIFRRFGLLERLDDNDSFSLIACDASGSVVAGHVEMVKMLSVALLGYALRWGFEIMVGLYNSEPIEKGATGPVVRWIYHPEKTPTMRAARSAPQVACLKNHGKGVQSDALSLLFMMDEAVRMARGRAISMTLITDCRWNSSFGRMTGQEEVRWFFESARRGLKRKFHSTLIAVGTAPASCVEAVVDKVIFLPTGSLKNLSTVSQQIALSVGQRIGRNSTSSARAELIRWAI